MTRFHRFTYSRHPGMAHNGMGGIVDIPASDTETLPEAIAEAAALVRRIVGGSYVVCYVTTYREV